MNLGVDVIRPAVISIDCHRGHLDPSVATMPASPEIAARLTEANRQFFDYARKSHVPIVHLVTTYRDVEEIRANPFWRTRAEDPSATRKNVLRHNLVGSPGCTIMPGLCAPGDMVVDTKKRYDCFQGTDLDITLRTHQINTLLITGINTNSCVLATACAANVRDYAVIIVEDCVDTMDTPDHHAAALLCLRTAFGHVMQSADVLRLVFAVAESRRPEKAMTRTAVEDPGGPAKSLGPKGMQTRGRHVRARADTRLGCAHATFRRIAFQETTDLEIDRGRSGRPRLEIRGPSERPEPALSHRESCNLRRRSAALTFGTLA